MGRSRTCTSPPMEGPSFGGGGGLNRVILSSERRVSDASCVPIFT